MAKERIYPFAVASVRSMENKLLTKQKLMQMAEAKDAEEAKAMVQVGDTAVYDSPRFKNGCARMGAAPIERRNFIISKTVSRKGSL